MQTLTAANFVEYHRIVQEETIRGGIFRGHKHKEYDLIPTFGRYLDDFEKHGLTKIRLLWIEPQIIELFQMESTPYLNFSPENLWEWISLAQHHGLPTRFLDWTHNPLHALYFAVEEEFDNDGAVYILKFSEGETVVQSRVKDEEIGSPFDIDDLAVYYPRHLHPRIANQKGVFTVHPDPTEELPSDRVIEITIPRDSKAQIRESLFMYGIDSRSIFPDLEGLAKWITDLKLNRAMKRAS